MNVGCRIVGVLLLAVATLAASGPNDRADVLMGLARVRRDAGDAAAARKYFEDARRLRPFTADDLIEYFWVLLEVDRAKAVDVGQEILVASPARRDVRENTVLAAAASRRDAIVVELAERGATIHAGDPLWPRRLAEAELRRRRPARAVTAYQTVVRLGGATETDRAGLATALEAAGRHQEAVAAWSKVSPAARRGDPRWTESYLRALAHVAPAASAAAEVERWIAGGRGSREMRDLAAELGRRASDSDALAKGHAPSTSVASPAESAWSAVERAVGLGHHKDALRLLEAIPAGERSSIAVRRREGELRLWTGDAAGAIAILEPLLGSQPDDLTARAALVDAHRTLGHAPAAWALARPMLDGSELSFDRLVILTELAIEAHVPDAVASLVERWPSDQRQSSRARALVGRAAQAAGRSAEAYATLAAVDPRDLTPPAALALVDSAATVRGVTTARALAWTVDASGEAWRDLVIRRAMFDLLDGDAAARARARALVDSTDPETRAIVLAEVALRRERPHEALTELERAGAGTESDRRRLDDLRALALAGIGDHAAALELTRARRIEEPDDPALRLREAELTWQVRGDAAALGALLEIADGAPRNVAAAVAAARALSSTARHAEALARLEAAGPLPQLSFDGLDLGARLLALLGRAPEGLALLDQAGTLPRRTAVVRAQLLAEVEGRDAAADAFRALAEHPETGADVFAAWAALVSSPAERVAILERARARGPEDPAILIALAAARNAAGDYEGARAIADESVSLDPRSGDAWYHLIDATVRTGSREHLDVLLTRFSTEASTNAALLVGTADRVAGLVRGPADPLVPHALSWLNDGRVPAGLALARDVTRVRVLAAAERWADAVSAADDAARRHAGTPAVARLRAEVLSWAGRHDDAVAAYDAYLSIAPFDVEARRQQARVLGWAGRVDAALARYAALVQDAPEHTAIAAEARAKRAFLENRWRQAVALYDGWLAVEPGNSEARFERAEALRASGDVTGADAALANLAADTGHRLAIAASERARRERAPSTAFVLSAKSSSGYLGRRLLDLRHRGVSLRLAGGDERRTTLVADVVEVRAEAGDARRVGFTGAASTTHTFSAALSGEGRLAVVDLGGGSAPVVEARAEAAWTPRDRWRLSAGLLREALFDNVAVIDQGLVAAGVTARADHATPNRSFSTIGSWQALSDGNRRGRVQGAFTRVLSNRLGQLSGVVWGEMLSHARPADSYFSPRGFLRLDAGLVYTYRFTTPRFRGDRDNLVTGGYLVGTDSEGTLYHHPSVRLARELPFGLQIEGRADVVRSASYRETSIVVSVRVLGSPER